MMVRSDTMELAIATRMLEVGEPDAAYNLAVLVLHKVGGEFGDDARASWDEARSLARRAMSRPQA